MANTNIMLSPNFSAAELIQAGETWAAIRVSNSPIQPETWSALRQLCIEILEPVRARFGQPVITYGFASEALARLIPGRIYPSLDQHAGYELRANGQPICKRLGQAVDFYVEGISSTALASWVANTLPFDRLYYYGPDRPIHVSVGPENSRSVVAMLRSPTGRRTPRRVSAAWLESQGGGGSGAGD